MKYYLLLMVFGVSCFLACAESISEDELERLKDKAKIGSVNDDIIEREFGDEEKKYFELSFYTMQDSDSPEEYKFYVRVVVELTDKKTGTVCYSKAMREQGEIYYSESYLGEDDWRFLVPLGKLNRPKATAYVVQYGIYDDDKNFIVVAEDMDDVESIDELIERTPTQLEGDAEIWHQYFYTNVDDEDDWSGWEK